MREHMNVLLTCAGRRNYLVKYFRDALMSTGKVFVTDMNSDAPAMHEADGAFLVPAVDADGYVDNLLELCKKVSVGLVVSLNDLELPLLSAARTRFTEEGILVSVSEKNVIDTCFDKWKTFEFLRAEDFSVPETFLSLAAVKSALEGGRVSYPLIIKPRWGTASIGVDLVEDEEELELAVMLTRKRVMRSMLARASGEDPKRCVLIQEKIVGQEYGLDLVNDFHGQHKATFVKRKLGMRAGETDKAVTESNPVLEELGERLSNYLGHYGIVDCDVFWNGEWATILEMNPRFGGGYPFSHVAGANIPAALIAWASAQKVKTEWLTVRQGISSAKCDRLVVVGREETMPTRIV